MNVVLRSRTARWVLLVVVTLPLGGCAVLLDLVNPTLPLQLGIDLAPVLPAQGTLIVSFFNGTRSAATFYAYRRAAGTTNLDQDSQNYAIEVAAGAVGNEVLDCPVDIVGPGQLDATFTAIGPGAVVDPTGTPVQVEYLGTPLESGTSYSCGDVVEFRLTTVTTTGTTGDAAQQYLISVRVIPGG